ncbi:MAG: hypothetical protein A3E78_11810 [Alphaproteobacteria bacterium RIFCSPHIGHO2_12_FULL_63_12]|nr:MAG: hypothetical protein A3E78_11810 [Alphaproteobacteria bacterium RIFCSPHIGHO2_12_FULL_63_12]
MAPRELTLRADVAELDRGIGDVCELVARTFSERDGAALLKLFGFLVSAPDGIVVLPPSHGSGLGPVHTVVLDLGAVPMAFLRALRLLADDLHDFREGPL